MYIGPWQEYRLAQAVGGGGARRRRKRPLVGGTSEEARCDSSLSARSSYSFASTGTASSSLEDINPHAVNRLIARLQQASLQNDAHGQKQVLEEFLAEHASRPTPPLADFDIDPTRTKMLEESAKERRRVQIRRDRGPLKLQKLEKKKQEFLKQLEDKSTAQCTSNNQVNEEYETLPSLTNHVPMSTSSTTAFSSTSRLPSILPTRPSLLFNSFLPAQKVPVVQDQQFDSWHAKTELNFNKNYAAQGLLEQQIQGYKEEEQNFNKSYAAQGLLEQQQGYKEEEEQNLWNRKANKQPFHEYQQESDLSNPLVLPSLSQPRNVDASADLRQLDVGVKEFEPTLSSPNGPSTLMEDDVDDLLNWTNALGSGADGDDFF